MGIRQWPTAIRSFFTKANPAGPLIVSSYGLSQPVRTPRRFDNLASEGYQSQSPVFRGINLIATGCAGIPWLLYERKGSNRRGLEINQHPLIDLMQRPNPNQGWGKFFEAYVSYLYIAGNTYLWANQPKGSGPPMELWTLRPDRMRVVPDEKQFVSGYTYEVNGKHIDFDRASVLHTKTFAPLDDWYGMSPLVVAARSVDTRNAGGDWNLALLQNSGRVPGFFTTKERLGDLQFSRMREQLLDRYTGTRNIGLPGLLDGGDISWLPAGMTPLDMDWAALNRETAREICMVLGVPSEMMGDPEVKTYASYSEARSSFYTETILPLMDILRDELNRWLVPMYGGNLWLDYDTEDIEALGPLRAARWAQVNVSNFLTVNEKREAVGYDAIPGGDVIVVLTTNATLDQVEHGQADGAQNGVSKVPANVRVVPTGNPGLPPPHDANDTDEGAPAPAPEGDGPGDTGVLDDSIGEAGVSSGEKAYDPLDAILAGKAVRLRPKAAAPRVRPSRFPRRNPHATA